jgi:hypothetical protein
MDSDMTIDDAINVARVVGDLQATTRMQKSESSPSLPGDLPARWRNSRWNSSERRRAGTGSAAEAHSLRRARRLRKASTAAGVATSWQDVPYTLARGCSS